MGILLPFNTALTYSWDELLQTTGLNPETLQGNLALLVKAKILTESDKKYTLNDGFKSKKLKVNLNIAIKSEQKQESDDTHKTIAKDRELVIQVLYI